MKTCANCETPVSEWPMVFRGDRTCCERCRRALAESSAFEAEARAKNPPCPECQGAMAYAGGDYVCTGCGHSIGCLPEQEVSEGGDDMGLTKHGTGEVLREPEDNAKTASQNWTPADKEALAKENRDADGTDDEEC